jgi:hypothetical protein
MNEPTSYLVRFTSLDEAIAAAVDLDAADVLELWPDGTCRAIQWDGEPAQQPCLDPVPELPCGEGIITYLARRLAENPPPCTSGWQPPCNLKMPGYKPDQADS